MDVYGLIGNPVGHSLSPPMHEAGYEAVGIDARYVTFQPARGEAVSAVEAARTLGIRGLNVTIPFKQAVLEAVAPDDRARRIGAVNTIDLAADPPTGHNTDVDGVRRSFEHHEVPLAGERAVVIGAGGAGRAAAYALAEANADVAIANRTAEKARSLARELDGPTGHGLDALAELVPDASILINATSVGMETDETVVPARYLHDGLAVLDAVYTPLETRLLREADEAGATTIDGAWMLLYQGVEAFERWTGKSAPVDAMNRALRERLKG